MHFFDLLKKVDLYSNSTHTISKIKISIFWGVHTIMKIHVNLRPGNFHFEQATIPHIPVATDITPTAIVPPIKNDVY